METGTGKKELTLWIAAAAVAALATGIMFDAPPGANWGVWTSVAAFGLLPFSRHAKSPTLVGLAIAASIIAFGAAITAAEFLQFLIFVSVVMLLALEMLLSPNPLIRRLTPTFAVPAPIVAFVSAIIEAARRASHALQLVRSEKARSVLRGVVITVPVVIIFALLLATADPIFARWRNAIEHIITNWEFLPRTIFFFGMLTIVLGAYGFASREHAVPANPVSATPPRKWLGATERLILLASVATLFWIFLAVQLSYLFGTQPQVEGSGITFAEYARRGFAELSVVASASFVLILVSERFGQTGRHANALRIATLAVVVAILFLLGSAFNRVLLYEQAYGFTTARLYAQAYMLIVASALVALGWEIRDILDPARLFRRIAAIATLVFIVLLYWNHEAWIANRNIDRVATTGRLDTAYLTRDLSPNAVPTLVRRLPGIAEPFQSELKRALIARYEKRQHALQNRWFEWNYGRWAAQEALKTIR